jgi:hypothetical protein
MNDRNTPYLLNLKWDGKVLTHRKETGWACWDGNNRVQLPHDTKGFNNSLTHNFDYLKLLL